MPPVGNASYLITRFGGGSGVVQDAALSPLRYLGPGALTGTEYRAYQETTFLSIAADIQGNFLSPSIGNDLSPAQIVGVQVLPSLTLAFRVVNEEASALRVYAGGTAQGITHIKLQTAYGNSATASDVYFGVGAFGRVEKDFSLFGQAFRASSQLSLPLLGAANRPSYSTTVRYPATAISNPLGILSEVRGVSIAAFPILDFRNSLEFMLGSGNFLALNYDWNFYSYTHFNKVQSARHAISVAFLFKF
ncbi:MAG: hypothetical protein EAZ92_16000 [Candidatus Kapaibacterium sp.]|nr:MAG: hypothetical protein EAZ92_16000 [Candidatus Kapabacteria bacterium]